ncbi:hypothetical protein [Labrys sp. ZIDIC5]|uniref:hypothetical protein n=1 Tax=Labrys sedimenti TaxID=3106036 RepID=UPI002ACACA9E|nr:hypothetical protein [Labrys sp. ZIDIC5]MDZ5448982.1 hypothetical protein [Labrys sp. ZIDIC5]
MKSSSTRGRPTVGSRPATARDVEKILGKLSARSKSEIHDVGLSPSGGRKRVIEQHKASRGLAITINDDPVALLLLEKEGDQIETLFVSKEEYWAAGPFQLSLLRHAKTIVDKLQADNPGCRIITRSRARDGVADKWFRFLGYDIPEAAEPGAERVFALQPKQKKSS